MSSKTPNVATPPPAPAAPTVASATVQAQANAAMLAGRSMGGSQSTILTGPQGLIGGNPTPGKTLLGQ